MSQGWLNLSGRNMKTIIEVLRIFSVMVILTIGLLQIAIAVATPSPNHSAIDG